MSALEMTSTENAARVVRSFWIESFDDCCVATVLGECGKASAAVVNERVSKNRSFEEREIKTLRWALVDLLGSKLNIVFDDDELARWLYGRDLSRLSVYG